jgi:hypothetical protein
MLSDQETESCQEKEICECLHSFFGENFLDVLEDKLVYV